MRRRLISLLVLLGTVALISLPFSLFSAKADLTFGPHEAQYQVTADSRLTVDFGPLGTLLIPVDQYLPLGLGAKVVIGEIPVSGEDDDEDLRATASQRRADPPGDPSSEGAGGGTIDSLGGDIASYAALFSTPEVQISQVITGLSREILSLWALSTALVSGLLVALAFFLGEARIRGLGRSFQGKELYGLSLSAVLIFASVGIGVVNRPDPVVADPAFAGTPLAGAQVTGRLGGVIDSAFGAVKKFSDDNNKFYDGALENLYAQWNSRPLTGNWSSQGMVPPAGNLAGEDVTTLVFTSDIHCNVGMARVAGAVTKLVGADGYVDGGDLTMTGTAAENYCLDVLDAELPNKLPRVIVKGNHDSSETMSHARSKGWNVLENSTANIAGVTFFGGPDPRRTVFGSGPQLETKLTADQYAQTLADQVCTTDFDLLLVHDARITKPALRTGCVDVSLSGHWHRRIGPENDGRGVRFLSSTTGGALPNALTPGPLRMNAEINILRIDNRTKRPIDVQVVTVTPDQEILIDPWVRFPQSLPLAVPGVDAQD